MRCTNKTHVPPSSKRIFFLGIWQPFKWSKVFPRLQNPECTIPHFPRPTNEAYSKPVEFTPRHHTNSLWLPFSPSSHRRLALPKTSLLFVFLLNYFIQHRFQPSVPHKLSFKLRQRVRDETYKAYSSAIQTNTQTNHVLLISRFTLRSK